jgi:hypothetical protein
MANTTLQLKKSGVTGNVPNSLVYGELAINYADGKLFYKASNGSIASISTGSTTDSFATINANSSLILATSPYDTLSIIPGNNITISTDTVNKKIIINSTASGDASTDQFARDKANSANVLAQAAYNQANTALSNTNLNVSGTLRMLNQGGDEGGELFLDKPLNSTSLAAGITIDIFQNKLRFFETGGSVRGVFIDIANSASAGVGTDLLNPTSAPDTVARTTASAAFDKANSANVLAQAAFDKANTVVSNSFTIITGGQYVDYGWVPMTPAPILFDYGTL